MMKMKSLKITLLSLIILIFSTVNTLDISKEEGVLVLTDENFDEAIAQQEFLLVEFYAPWCGACKKFAPEYAKAAQVLSNDNIFLAKIDVTVHKVIGERFKIERFPTIKLFTKGQPSDYYGGKKDTEVITWMRKNTSGSASKELLTVEAAEAFTTSAVVTVVLFSTDEALLKTYENVARLNNEILFAHCGVPACLEKWSVQNGTVVLFKKFDEGRNDLTSFDEDSLKNFVKSESTPLIMPFDKNIGNLIFGENIGGIFLYRDQFKEGSEKLDAIFKSAARKLKGKIQAVITDIDNDEEQELAKWVGVNIVDLPLVRIHAPKEHYTKYIMTGDITEENILAFFDDFTKGKVKPFVKSEEIPTEQKENAYNLVGKSFNSIVMDSTKDVLVLLYAPWCTPSKKLAPIYEELALSLKHNSNLVIAKMDVSLNEIQDFRVKATPTIFLFPANDKSKALEFEGIDKTLVELTKFIAEKAHIPVKAKEDL